MASGRQELENGKILAPAPEVDFALVLSRVIASAEEDPSQLRSIIYELARIKLQEEMSRRSPSSSSAGTLSVALESAIERAEAIHSKHDSLEAIRYLDRLVGISQAPGRIVSQEAVRVYEHSSPSFLSREMAMRRTRNRAWLPGAAPLLRGAIVAILALAGCVVLDHQFVFLGQRASQALTPVVHSIEKVALKAAPAQAPGQSSTSSATTARSYAGVPLPSVYGIYSISAGRLHELEPLAIGRVPDPRVFMSTPIKTPSHTVLPDGRTEFIIYRRDIANDSPDRITVRVIAKVQRAMTFNSAGQAGTMDVEDSWTIRNVSYDFRVAPLGDSSEMLVVRPEKEEFVLPAGRYALVVKGQAYDFTVAGPITAAAQCLERVDAANGTFYSECGRPNEKRISSASRNLK